MLRSGAVLLGLLLAGLSGCGGTATDAVTGVWSRSYSLEAFSCVDVIGFSVGGSPRGSWYEKDGCPYTDTEAGFHMRTGTYEVVGPDGLLLTTLQGSCTDDQGGTRTISFSASRGGLTLVDGPTTKEYLAISGETKLFPGHGQVEGCWVGTPVFFEPYPLTDLPLPDGGTATGN